MVLLLKPYVTPLTIKLSWEKQSKALEDQWTTHQMPHH